MTLTLGGQNIELPPEFWTVLNLIYMLTVAMAYLWVARQLGS